MGSTGTNGGYSARQATSRAPTATLSCNLSGTYSHTLALPHAPTRLQNFVKPELLVSDSEYNQSTGAKPILSPSCIYLVSPGALLLLLLLRQLRIFAAAAVRPRPHPAPFFGGREVFKKNESPVASGVAFGYFCVGVGVGEAAVAFCFAGGFGLLDGSYTHRKQVYWVVDYSFLDTRRALIGSP